MFQRTRYNVEANDTRVRVASHHQDAVMIGTAPVRDHAGTPSDKAKIMVLMLL